VQTPAIERRPLSNEQADESSIGQLNFVEQLFGAILDQARKYRKRSPAERERLFRDRLQQKKAERR
jgi:hypothetical protein